MERQQGEDSDPDPKDESDSQLVRPEGGSDGESPKDEPNDDGDDDSKDQSPDQKSTGDEKEADHESKGEEKEEEKEEEAQPVPEESQQEEPKEEVSPDTPLEENQTEEGDKEQQAAPSDHIDAARNNTDDVQKENEQPVIENGHQSPGPPNDTKPTEENLPQDVVEQEQPKESVPSAGGDGNSFPSTPPLSSVQRENGSMLSTPKRDDCTRFMTIALRNLIPLCSKRFAVLKDHCTSLLSTIEPEAPGQIQFPGNPSAGLVHPTQVYVYVLRLACETGDLKIVQTALDCLHKILSFGVVNDTIPGSLPLIVFAKRSKMPIPPSDSDLDGDGSKSNHPWKGKKTGLLTELVSSVCGVSFYNLSEVVVLPILKSLLTAATESQLHGYALRMVVTTVFQLTVMNSQGANAATAKTTLTQIVNSIFSKMDASLPESESTVLKEFHNDASLVFQYICGLPETVDVTEYTASETNEMKVMISSLSLIQKLLSSGGTSFARNRAFIASIKKPLIYAVVKACCSPVPVVVKLGLQIFMTLLTTGLCHPLRREIGIVFDHVITQVLEHRHASTDQKLLVADALQGITTRSQLLVELFVNYDCALHESHFFEKLTASLARLIMSPNTEPDTVTVRQDNALKLLALQNAVSTLKSLHHHVTQVRFPDVPSTHAPCTVAETEKIKQTKDIIEECADLFNRKPKKGAALLIEKGICEDTPESLAACFENLKELDRSMVGEFLGEPDEYNLSVLRKFCSVYDTSEMSLDESLRNFLGRFALPKEGQKIERILEHFSEVFYEQHETGTCRTSEAVFVLAVGIVMLNTDLHNPQIEKKMTLERFISQFKGVNDGKDFDPEYLKQTYANIRSNPIMDVQLAAQMEGAKPAEERSAQLFSAFSSKRDRKSAMYTTDISKVSSNVKSLLAGVPPDAGTGKALFPTSIDHVKPMFLICWGQLLASFSMQFEQRSVDPTDQKSLEILKLCIEGITVGIHIAAHFELHTERESYMRGLCAMTRISSKKSPTPGAGGIIQEKNILAIRALLKVPLSDAECLFGSWLPYLRIVSEVEHYRSLGVQLRRSQNANKSDESMDEDHLVARSISVNIEEQAIHKIISRASAISQAGLKEFSAHLCTVALEEVNLPSPRRFLLEKTVEIASENMGPRLLCLWKDTSKLLVAVGTHQNPDIAEYGIDALRQLVTKSIAKEELLKCKIQPELLLPFHGVMSSSLPSKQVRDLILICMSQLVEARPHFIGPGWPVLMKILIASVTKYKETTALETVSEIMTKVLGQGALESVIPYLPEVIDCIVFLIQNYSKTPELSKRFATKLANLPADIAGCQPDNGSVESTWENVFAAFSYLILLPIPEIRTHCVTELGRSLAAAIGSKSTFPDSAWCLYTTEFAVDSVLRPLGCGTVAINKAEKYRHFSNNEITGPIDTVSSEVFGSEVLPKILDNWFTIPLTSVSLAARSQVHLSHLIAVLCNLCKRDSKQYVVHSIGKLEAILTSKHVTNLLDEEGWHIIVEHIRCLFKEAILRTALLKRFSTSPSEEDEEDPITEFPDNFDLCPAELDEIRSENENSWVAILYGHEEGTSLSYYAEEHVIVSDLIVRYIRQAGLLALFEKLLTSTDVLVDWTKLSSPLHSDDFLNLFSCLKHCHATAKVFFSEDFDRWRKNLQPETLEMVRRRRSKALQLNMIILFDGYNAENKVISDHARASLLPDALLLVKDYYGSSERSCLEQPLTSVASHLLDLKDDDFRAVQDVFYAPLCRCLELEGSADVRKEIVRFLLRAHPT